MPGKHDQSTHGHGGRVAGKDLIGSGGGEQVAEDIDAQAAKSTTELGWNGARKGPNGDEQLHAIAQRQGFDGKPQVVTKETMDDLIGQGHIELHRGIGDPDVERVGAAVGSKHKTGADLAEEYRHGGYFAGYGAFGNGTYASVSRAAAKEYSNGHDSSIMRMALHKDAKVADYGKMLNEYTAFYGPSGLATSARQKVFGDVGRYAAARGYDAIFVPKTIHTGPNGKGSAAYVILNRTAVYVQAAS
jgi:hypothetical protein